MTIINKFYENYAKNIVPAELKFQPKILIVRSKRYLLNNFTHDKERFDDNSYGNLMHFTINNENYNL